MNTSYPTNLNDSQWSAILIILNDKRKRKHSLREILMQSSICLKLAVSGECSPKIFRSGN